MIVAYHRSEIPPLPGSVGFVPTMGALHEGHASLIRTSVARGHQTVVSIYVNPTQFAPHEDFTKYPRTLEADLQTARKCGAQVVYVPSSDEIYERPDVSVSLSGSLSERWEASVRPTHFSGVATVVLKLLNIVRADEAFFGQKDLQQCQVIQTMIDLLFVNTKMVVCPTVREADGLAMSSRNRYLNEYERQIAPKLQQALANCQQNIKSGVAVGKALEIATDQLTNAAFKIDYFSMVGLPTMEPLLAVTNSIGKSALITAAALGNTRLLDNVVW